MYAHSNMPSGGLTTGRTVFPRCRTDATIITMPRAMFPHTASLSLSNPGKVFQKISSLNHISTVYTKEKSKKRNTGPTDEAKLRKKPSRPWQEGSDKGPLDQQYDVLDPNLSLKIPLQPSTKQSHPCPMIPRGMKNLYYVSEVYMYSSAKQRKKKPASPLYHPIRTVALRTACHALLCFGALYYPVDA
jgi:hypothetical protein